MSQTSTAVSAAAHDVRRIEQVCDRFEAAWTKGERPRIESYVDGVREPMRLPLLRHLLALDWEYRARAGEVPQTTEYLARFPDASAAIEAVAREVAAEKTVAGRYPQRLGEYRIVRQVGRGGMGIVYEALHESQNRRVALKLLPHIDLADPTARERFWREAHMTARLDHPNIVPIYEVGEHDGQLFLALEFVAGPSLSDQLRKSSQPPREAAALVETVARAVEHAHQQGIVHRDLKPANILLATEPSNFDYRCATVKVTDFGLAHPMNGSDLTATGDILGTPGYMAPEQAWGKSKRHAIGPATDVYALGAVLYAMMTGRPPFQGSSPLDALEQVRSQDPVPPSRLQAHIPRDLETICLKCLEKEPGQRYASAALLADDLRRFLAGQRIVARRPSWLRRAKQWCQRNPASAAATSLGAVAVAAAVGLAISQTFAVQLRREQRLTQTALEEAKIQRAVAATKAQELFEQQKLTSAALVDAEHFRGQADRLSVSLALERGLTLLEQNDVARGMLVLAHSLKITPAGASDLEHVIRSNLSSAYPQLPFHLQSVLEHGGEVQSVVFSPDGKVLLTGGRESGARRWDAVTGEPIGERLPHEDEIRAVAFSADGSMIATAGADKTARLWDAASSEPIGKPFRHAHWVQAVAISPDKKTVLTGSADGTARVWDAETGERRGELRPPGWVYAVAISPDGRILATGSGNRGQLWQADTLEPIGEPLRHQGEVWAMDFSPDGRTLATASEDGTARLWEAETGKPVGLPLQHQRAVRSLSYGQDGKTLATASVDGKIRLWDARRLTPLGAPMHHQSAIYAVAVSPDQSRLATGSSDGKVRLWQNPSPRSPGVDLAHDRLVYCVAVTPDGKTIATGTADRNVRLWNVETGQLVGKPLSHPASVLRMAFSPDGATLVTACSDNTARLWDIEKKVAREVVLEHKNHVYAVAFSPDGKSILTGSKDSTARVWDADTGEPRFEPLLHADWVHSAVFSPDGRLFLTGCEDRTARLWDANTGEPIGEPIEHRGPVRAVAFSPDGRMILTGTWDDGTARLWDATTREPVGPPLLHQEHVLAVAFSPSGKMVATGAWDGTSRLWDVATGKPLGLPLSHQRTVRDVAFSPDGTKLLTASFDRTARCWELPEALAGDADRIILWIEVLAGMELDRDGLFRDLDADSWNRKRELLQEMGGPPR